ncbi:MAG: hypothetical protein HKL84_10205 [Acidimicrobiaceae bacterium]|nr:hypothetical protein [Acidimicrobiaceae bacterium]
MRWLAHSLIFPVSFGVDWMKVGGIPQGYTNEAHWSLESPGFLLRPGGAIELAVYSSGPVGRPAPEDVMSIVRCRRAG